MVPNIEAMKDWSKETEEEISTLIKDWLKVEGRTQADLKKSLSALNSRMPAILEELKKDWFKGGMIKVVDRLCSIEEEWANKNGITSFEAKDIDEIKEQDPFGQLDFLIEAINEDCENS